MTYKTKNKLIIRGTLALIILVIFVFSYGNKANAEMTSYQKDFVDKWKVSAVKYGKKYGIFPSQILAQGAFESDWGRSSLAVKNNNLFGIRDGSDGWKKFSTQDECVEFYILNFFKTQASGYEEIIKTNSPIGTEKYITMGYAPLTDGNSDYLTTYPQIVENADTNFLQYDLMAFPSEEKKYANIEEVRNGKKDDLTMVSAGKIDWKGKKPTITDTSIKVDGLEESKSDDDKETTLNVKYSFDENMIPGMPKARDYDEGDTTDLGDSSVKLDSAEGDQLLLWRDEYDNQYRYSTVNVVRALVTALGRILIIYAVILLACYMYDLTKIHEGSLFSLLTFGRLAVSYSGESTFRDKNATIKEVNKANLVFIITILVITGILLTNGYFYVFISNILKLIDKLYELIKGADVFNS